jgi:hypothetical protein
MKTSKTTLVLVLSVFLILLAVPVARAIRPLYSPFSVVAGTQFTAGFKDGSFSTARFNQPLGLAVSDDGTQLFVADSLNNRIRVIHLDQNNEVGTVVGQASPGNLDGPLTLAQFHEPRGVLYLPNDHLVINDFVNQSIRFVDLKAGMVTTYRGGPVQWDGSAPPASDIKPPVLLNGIKDMAYLPIANSILFTQPEAGVLNALNLGTGQLTTLLKDNAQIPHPSALWIQDNKISVADRDLQSVYSTDWKNNGVTNMQPAGTPADKVMSLCSSDNMLYGLLKKDGYPAQRFLLDKRYAQDDCSNGLVKFNNGWGDFIPAEKYYEETIQPNSPWAGFVPDPSSKRKFFFSIPSVNVIVTIRDLFLTSGFNSVNLLGAEYPAEKPKNTYRILLCGDCRTTDTDAFLFPTDSHPAVHPTEAPFFPPNLSIAPQVEHELNFQAALDDNPMNYEFLSFGRHGDLIFWPTIEVPDEAKKLDVDLVVIFSPNLDKAAFQYYFLYNLTPDGIPHGGGVFNSPPDPEYILRPPLERIPDGLPRRFYEYCKKHGYVKIEGNNFVWDDAINSDPQLHDMILEFWGKPWQVLNRKLSSMRTSSGNPVRLLVLFGYQHPLSPDIYKPEFYKEVARKYKIPFYDLNPTLNALHLSYFPMCGHGHSDPNGAVFLGKLLTQVFRKEHLIPWPTVEPTPSQ